MNPPELRLDNGFLGRRGRAARYDDRRGPQQAAVQGVARADHGKDVFFFHVGARRVREGFVLVRVKGDSMINAGIHSGDLAVVERRSQANPGEVVVAVVDDEFTLKTLGRDKDGYHLLPANPNYPVIRPNGKLEIFGVLVGLVRKYQ